MFWLQVRPNSGIARVGYPEYAESSQRSALWSTDLILLPIKYSM